MDLKQLNQAISKREFSNLYFFYGEEDYLKEFYINRIIHSVVDDNFACFNLFSYHERPSREELQITLSQPPVMAEYKVVYLNELNLAKADAPFRDFLCEQMINPADFLILIIRETQPDKRSRIFTTAQKHGETVECTYPAPADLRAFINREFTKRGKKISPSLINRIVEENEPSLYSVLNLIETVSAYLQDTDTVTSESLDQLMQKSTNAVIFNLSEALVNGDKEETYRLLNALKLHQSKNPPQLLFSLITGHIMGLYLATVGQKEGFSNPEIKKLLGKNVPDFVIGKYQRQARSISQSKLEELLLFCADTDYKLKNGQIKDPYLGIYTLFLKFWES